MNIWSMDESGKGLKQHTRNKGGTRNRRRSKGAHRLPGGSGPAPCSIFASGSDRVIPIELVSDFDHLRERWVKEPMNTASRRTSRRMGSRWC